MMLGSLLVPSGGFPSLLQVYICIAAAVLPSTHSAAFTQAEKDEFVKAHNDLRKAADPKPTGPMNLVKWSADIEKSVQATVKSTGCTFRHTDDQVLQKAKLGENLYFIASPAGPPPVVPTDVVKDWHSEKAWFDHRKMKCFPTKKALENNLHASCGHYTQVMQGKLTEIGCAKCENAKNQAIVWCQYNVGNIQDVPFYQYDPDAACPTCTTVFYDPKSGSEAEGNPSSGKGGSANADSGKTSSSGKGGSANADSGTTSSPGKGGGANAVNGTTSSPGVCPTPEGIHVLSSFLLCTFFLAQ